jgi:hypothetical protein
MSGAKKSLSAFLILDTFYLDLRELQLRPPSYYEEKTMATLKGATGYTCVIGRVY